jgi:hypothetical protein
MGTKLSHGAGLPGTTAEYCFSVMANVREAWEASMHTLIALSQATFSSQLNDLHSLRTCGVLQSHQATADQRTTRATERTEGKSIGGRLGMRREHEHIVQVYRLFMDRL